MLGEAFKEQEAYIMQELAKTTTAHERLSLALESMASVIANGVSCGATSAGPGDISSSPLLMCAGTEQQGPLHPQGLP